MGGVDKRCIEYIITFVYIWTTYKRRGLNDVESGEGKCHEGTLSQHSGETSDTPFTS